VAESEEEFRLQVKLQPGNAEAAYRLGDALLEQVRRMRRARTFAGRSIAAGNAGNPLCAGEAASLEVTPRQPRRLGPNFFPLRKQSSLAAQAHFGLAALYPQTRKDR